VHLKDTLRDLVGAQEDGHSWSLRSAMERIAREGAGVVVLLRPHESPLEIAEAVRSAERPHSGAPVGGARVLRTYGVGAQILRDLGITRMRVLSAPIQMHGLSAFGLEVSDYID
jgi:3,4-dihydroxy 2-butanone 4-phosphate synthase/GTP cyclohydrolase II